MTPTPTPTLAPDRLLAHIDSGEPWPADLPTGAFGDIASAYQTALAVRALRMARGEVPRGYKIGFTNRGLWDRYGVHAPIWGTVWDSTLTQSAESDMTGDGAASAAIASLSLQGLCEPRIEPEVVFGLKHTPPIGAGLDELWQSIAWVAPGFELVQSHRRGWKFDAADTVADSGLHGRLLIGRRVPLAGFMADAEGLVRMLASARVHLQCDEAEVESGVGANVLDSPLHALAHFVRELRTCPGAPDLAAGDVVTTGTWTDAWAVRPGECWRSNYGGALPGLQVTFT